MDLRVNHAIRINHEIYGGFYRVLAISETEIFLGVIQSEFKGIHKKSLLYTKSGGFCTTPLILKRYDFEEIINDDNVVQITTLVSNKALKSIDTNFSENAKLIERYKKNVEAMASCFDHALLAEHVIEARGFSKIVGLIQRSEKCDCKWIYRRLQKLIEFGFSETSLIPKYHNSGAPGKARPVNTDSKIVGAKPLLVRQAISNSQNFVDKRSGMKEEWKTLCALSVENTQKPITSLKKLYHSTIRDYFSPKISLSNGKFESVTIDRNEIPTYDQFCYWYRKRYSPIERIKSKTTSHNFNQNHRALLGRIYDGVGGPGHTYSIDSTIADVYLLSSLNRNKIAGRPIVYFLVDRFSGAIVGFYACFDGPKWDTAKLALFCTVYSQKKLCELLGVPYFEVFKYQPGLPSILFGDRGEYMDHQASITCFELRLNQEFSSPYRGDEKGDVEVQFKHIKDDKFHWVPGAHDARRIEMEKRQSHPLDATMTLHEFNIYIMSYIRKYNLTADMSHRLTDRMKATGVTPTPAGIWDWGFENGIGYATHTSDEELIRTLLPKVLGKTSKNGLNLDGRLYADPDNQLDQELAINARNFGQAKINAWYFPGNIQSIWTDHGMESGFRTIPRKDNDSRYVTLEEFQDARTEFSAMKSDLNHEKLEISLREGIIQSETIIYSKSQTGKSKPTSAKSIRENQKREVDFLRNALFSHTEDTLEIKKLLEADESFNESDLYDDAFNKVDGDA